MLRPGWLGWLLLLLAACDGSGCGSEQPVGDPGSPPSAVPSGLGAVLPPDGRESFLGKSIATLLEGEHLSRRRLDDEVSREAFDEYLERLDGGKLFLLKSHAAELRKLADQMDDEMRRGDLLLARRGEALLIERRALVARKVAEILRAPFDFSKDESIQTDPEKLAFVESEEALVDRWRKVLKLQVLQRVAAMEGRSEGGGAPIEDVPDSLEGKEKKAREDVATSYEARFKRLSERNPLDPADKFLGAVASVYDPHTAYLAPADKANFDIELSGSLEGIGALLGVKDHFVEVRELVPGGASWRQGDLEPGDLILAVAPEGKKLIEVVDLPLDRVVDMIRGPKGTVVTLRVQKPDRRIETISITRDVIVIEAAYARGAELDLGEGRATMGYIQLPSFYGNSRSEGAPGARNASEDVRKLLEIFEQRKLRGAILDLRGNGGGLLAHARDITGHLIEAGPVVRVRAADGSVEEVRDEDRGLSFSGDVVVLVDRFSASASEIVAGALQDYRRAVVVGTGPTHGKGTVQVLVDLERLPQAPDAPVGTLKLTTQQFFLVDGESTQARGVQPDIVLPDPAGFMETGERHLEHAIPWGKIEPTAHQPWPARWDLAALQAASKKRVAGDELFAAVAARNELLEARRDDTEVPLKRDAWVARQKRADEETAALRKRIEEGTARFEVRAIHYAGDDSAQSQDERIQKQIERRQKELARDPWVEEALLVLQDMGEAPAR